jgi:hypothetical protein
MIKFIKPGAYSHREKEMVMAVVARIIGYSLLTGGLGALLGHGVFGWDHGAALPVFLLACVGAIVGAVAGAAGEVVMAQRRLPAPEPLERIAKTFLPGD